MNKFLGLLLLVPVLAFSHGKLVETTPAADSTVSTPESIVLRFNQDAKLIKFLVTSENGERLGTTFKGSTPKSEHTILVPNLINGGFTVNWSVMGADGHIMTDSFAFKVRDRNAQDIKREADTFVDAISL
jgi:methionine-rich copper-binding protein CopC|tara:strand:- start:96 stop:485 length:390 start_codon:yes stop_codon:yes gene_type:complete